MPNKKLRNARRLIRKIEDLELLLLARERERAIRAGEDRLIPLEEVMQDLEKEMEADPLAPRESSVLKDTGDTGS
ncbi:MAG TPA: hypothetical protein VEQ60_31230 [Longimicrobium sp.]|nr:hypothetical protein [Longimicrobium sp.]